MGCPEPLMKSNAVLSPDNPAKMSPDKLAPLFPDKPASLFQNKLVPLFPDKPASMFPDKLVPLSPDKPALMYPDKLAVWSPDNNVSLFPGSLVGTFPSSNVRMFPNKFAKTNALTPIGARFAHKSEFDFPLLFKFKDWALQSVMVSLISTLSRISDKLPVSNIHFLALSLK